MASIRERVSKDGSTSTYAVLYNHENKQRSKSFRTLAAAKKFRALVEAVGAADALEIGKQKKSGGPTVAELAKQWLDYKQRDMTVEGHRDYVRQYAKWIEPTFGWREAETITERDVQRWVDTVLAPALGGKSVAGKHALLHGLYKWASAKTRGYVTHNPCKETELPKRTKPPVRGLSLPELHALIQAAHDLGHPDAADVIAFMAGTGFRLGEALAPKVGDVEASEAGVWVTMTQVFRRGEGVVAGGKTDAAGRRLQVLGVGADSLPRRLVGRGRDDLIFPNPTTGRPWNPTSFRRNYWQPIVEAAGLTERGPTPYWLRHTHVAVCHAAGLSLPEIQRRIGHESIQTTINVYGRLIEGMSAESAGRLDALLRPQGFSVVQGEVLSDPPTIIGE